MKIKAFKLPAKLLVVLLGSQDGRSKLPQEEPPKLRARSEFTT